MRERSGPAAVDAYLARARGVMIFPRLIKASLLVGGQGGNGVLLVKGADGAWSDPAFYSLGSASAGVQIGYQEASVILFFLDDQVLQRALYSDLTLGTNGGAALGNAAQTSVSRGEIVSKPIYELVEAHGAFAGVSLDGYLINSRGKHDRAYYGVPTTPREIVIEHKHHRAEADTLRLAFSPRSGD